MQFLETFDAVQGRIWFFPLDFNILSSFHETLPNNFLKKRLFCRSDRLVGIFTFLVIYRTLIFRLRDLQVVYLQKTKNSEGKQDKQNVNKKHKQKCKQ